MRWPDLLLNRTPVGLAMSVWKLHHRRGARMLSCRHLVSLSSFIPWTHIRDKIYFALSYIPADQLGASAYSNVMR
jgi:hypothetical protein